jgi:hypothetical protein
MRVVRRQPSSSGRVVNTTDPNGAWYCSNPNWQLDAFRALFEQLPTDGLRRLLRALTAGEVYLRGHLCAHNTVHPMPGPMVAWLPPAQVAEVLRTWGRSGFAAKKLLWNIAKKHSIEDLAVSVDCDDWPGGSFEAFLTSDASDVVGVVKKLLEERHG